MTGTARHLPDLDIWDTHGEPLHRASHRVVLGPTDAEDPDEDFLEVEVWPTDDGRWVVLFGLVQARGGEVYDERDAETFDDKRAALDATLAHMSENAAAMESARKRRPESARIGDYRYPQVGAA